MIPWTLASGLAERRNNFDFLRFIAAIMVIFSHSWPLTQGGNQHEPLAVLTSNQLDYWSTRCLHLLHNQWIFDRHEL
jgi:peptidoglycan/LPS O-acetylase OafA/YrhL